MTARRPWALALLLLAGAAWPGTVDGLAATLVARAGADGPTALAVRARDPAAARLADTLAGLLVARLPGAGRAESADAARRAGFERFVDVELAVDGAELVATGRVVETGRDLWAELAGRGAAGVASSFVVRTRIDGELRAYLGGTAPPASRPVRARRLAFRPLRGGLDLGAPLLALAAADLDGDGRAELIALTTDEVVVATLRDDGPKIVARAPLSGPQPVPRPRVPVGTLLVTAERRIVARSSEHDAGATFELAADGLRAAAGTAGFPLCEKGGRVAEAQLVPGQHLYARDGVELDLPAAALPSRFSGARCAGAVLAVVDPAGTLHLARAGDKAAWGAIPGVGTAFVLADLDDDGALELVAAGFRPPGAADTLTFYRIGDDGSARVLRRPSPTPAGVAALAAGDFDGDGAIDVVGAIRGADPGRFDLWLAD